MATDLLTTTFSEDWLPALPTDLAGHFEDVSAAAGLAAATTPYLGWAAGFADVDNDGERDTWLANGHVYPAVGKLGSTSYHQPFALFKNRKGRFLEVSAGPARNLPRLAAVISTTTPH